MVVAIGSSVATTALVEAVHAWLYRPRPVDTDALTRAMQGALRAAGIGCTGPHTCRGYRARHCRESCTACTGENAVPCYADHRA